MFDSISIYSIYVPHHIVVLDLLDLLDLVHASLGGRGHGLQAVGGERLPGLRGVEGGHHHGRGGGGADSGGGVAQAVVGAAVKTGNNIIVSQR